MINRYLILSLLLAGSLGAAPRQIWVSPSDSTGGDGSIESPYGSIAAAQRQARELRRLHDESIGEGIEIVLRDGTYSLVEPLFIRTEDSGTEKSPTVFKAAPNSQPVLSGGVEVSGWKLATGTIPGLNPDAKGMLWVAPTPRKNGGYRP